MQAPLGWSDAARVMLCGGVLGYALGVLSCVGFYLERTRYWKNRAIRAQAHADRAITRCSMLLRRQAE